MNHTEVDMRQAGILLIGVALLLYGVFGLAYGYPSHAPVLVFLVLLVALSGIVVGSFLRRPTRESE